MRGIKFQVFIVSTRFAWPSHSLSKSSQPATFRSCKGGFLGLADAFFKWVAPKIKEFLTDGRRLCWIVIPPFSATEKKEGGLGKMFQASELTISCSAHHIYRLCFTSVCILLAHAFHSDPIPMFASRPRLGRSGACKSSYSSDYFSFPQSAPPWPSSPSSPSDLALHHILRHHPRRRICFAPPA